MTIYSAAALPHELARIELANEDLTIAAYRALAEKQNALGPVPFETALRLVVFLHAKNHGRPFELDYELAIVDVVVRALRWYAYDIERTYTALTADWLLRYEQFDYERSASRHCHALRHALTTAYSS
jgi:hypothetical protein